jgi:hypothetical protein
MFYNKLIPVLLRFLPFTKKKIQGIFFNLEKAKVGNLTITDF